MSKPTYEHGFEIHRRGRDIYEAWFKYGSNPQKRKRVPESHLHGTIQDLKDYREEFKLELRGTTSKTWQRSDVTFGDFWPTALEELVRGEGARAMKQRTADEYRQRLEHNYVAGAIGKKRLDRIYADDIIGMVDRMKLIFLRERNRPLTPQTRNRYLTPVQTIFRHASGQQHRIYRGVNPVSAAGYTAHARKRRNVAVYDPEELALLFALLDEDNEIYVRLALGTGARQSELLGLRFEHFEIRGEHDSFVHIKGQRSPGGAWTLGTKNEPEGGNGGRYVNLAPFLVPLVRENGVQWERVSRLDPLTGKPLPAGVTRMVRPGDYLFPNLTHASIGHDLTKVRVQLGERFDGSGEWAPLTGHKLRHNFASQLIRHGATRSYVADQLGDAIAQVEATYAHEWGKAFKDPERSASVIMERVLSGV